MRKCYTLATLTDLCASFAYRSLRMSRTTARIQPANLVPTLHVAGIPSKMVDYALFLQPTEAEEEARNSTLRATASASINQTELQYLSRHPIAISIDAKAVAAETDPMARLQLAVWLLAQLQKLRNLQQQQQCFPEAGLGLVGDRVSSHRSPCVRMVALPGCVEGLGDQCESQIETPLSKPRAPMKLRLLDNIWPAQFWRDRYRSEGSLAKIKSSAGLHRKRAQHHAGDACDAPTCPCCYRW